ncbi:MAG: hypothetical protein AAGA30_10700 [Planctomycetota bacterium]
MKMTLFGAMVLGILGTHAGLCRYWVSSDQNETKSVSSSMINWETDLNQALEVAKWKSRPIFAAIGEVVDQDSLRHPLLIEAITNHFVPAQLTQRSILEKTSNKFTRGFIILGPKLEWLQSSDKDNLSYKEVAKLLIDGLKQTEQEIPTYLKLCSNDQLTETAEFAMHCYWEGEARLGGIDGVVSTKSAWRDGLEVVQLEFIPSVVDYSKLITIAQSFDCASKIFAHTDSQLTLARNIVGDRLTKRVSRAARDAKSSDQKYYLLHSLYRYLPLTQLQATKINARLKMKQPSEDLISPNQRQLLSRIKLRSKTSPQSLAGLKYPSEDSQLAKYQQQLLQKLER